MAHFARLDENNIVTAVHVVHNNELSVDTEVVVEDGFVKEKLVLSEKKGIQFLQGLYGEDTRWVQTSYNGSFRGKYAGIGDTYENGVFVAPEVPVVQAPVVEASVEVLATEAAPTLTSSDIPALTTSDLSVMTTSDISSLG
jgi:hypothetical protein